MAQCPDPLDLLVIRPWLATWRGGEAYPHFDALPMRAEGSGVPRRYADLSVLHRDDDGRQRLHLDGFRTGCQVDDRHAEAYAWFWGYRPARGEAFTTADVARHGPSITAIERAMIRMHEQDGPVGSIGRYVVRLARALKLDGLAVLDTSPTGSFGDSLLVRRFWTFPAAGDAVHLIDTVVLELHEACAARIRRAA